MYHHIEHLEVINSRILPREKVEKQMHYWRFHDEKIIFTNGCFDILHRGHIEYLAKAADLGTKLIVGVNSDTSVKKLNKGDDRPLQWQEDRALLIAALHFVSAVVIFDEETPYELIREIQPDVLVKGGDWKEEDIVGNDIVKARGGLVQSIQFVEGHSTTSIVEKIRG